VPRTEDSLTAKQAEVTAQQMPGQLAFDPVEMGIPEPLVAVPVRDEPPDQGVGNVVTLSAANPVLQLLPQDPRRRGAVVLAVDNDVYLSHSRDLAAFAQGANTGTQAAYLPAGMGIPVSSRNAWYVGATTTATSSRVTVLVYKDDE
jgi:hypothetical protein